jgi:hypothetical protein
MQLTEDLTRRWISGGEISPAESIGVREYYIVGTEQVGTSQCFKTIAVRFNEFTCFFSTHDKERREWFLKWGAVEVTIEHLELLQDLIFSKLTTPLSRAFKDFFTKISTVSIPQYKGNMKPPAVIKARNAGYKIPLENNIVIYGNQPWEIVDRILRNYTTTRIDRIFFLKWWKSIIGQNKTLLAFRELEITDYLKDNLSSRPDHMGDMVIVYNDFDITMIDLDGTFKERIEF